MSANTPDAPERIEFIPVESIDPAPSNRDIGSEESLEELARSIKAKGVLQPIVISPKGKGRYEVVFGHRRLEGAKRAGLETIRSEVREYSEQERRELRLIENVLRKDPTPLEEALAYHELLQLNPKLNQAKLSARLGIAQGTISRRLKLLTLPKKLQQDVNSGRVPTEDAYHLAKLAKYPERIERARAEAKKLGGVQLAVNKELEDMKNGLKRETALDDMKQRSIALAPEDWSRKGMRLGDDEGMLPIDPFEHQKEPCHAADISDAGAITYVCTAPERHGWGKGDSDGEPGEPVASDAGESTESEQSEQEKPSAERKGSSADKAAAQAEAERKAEAEADRARAEELRTAEQARRDTLRTALKGRLTKDMERHIYWQVLNVVQLDHEMIADELLRFNVAKDELDTALRTFASKSDERLKKAAFAALAMLTETLLKAKKPDFQHTTVAQHYEMLSRIGYTPSDVERSALHQAG